LRYDTTQSMLKAIMTCGPINAKTWETALGIAAPECVVAAVDTVWDGKVGVVPEVVVVVPEEALIPED
jgi:hypothetical protein